MDTEKCRVFLKVLEVGSLTRAAEMLGYTVSGVSRLVASIEKEAGTPLLIRNRDGVRATAECEMLLRSIREMAYWGERFEHRVRSIHGIETGLVVAGSSYDAYYPWLSRLISEFSALHPGIEMRILEGTSSELAEKVDSHEGDFCICSERKGHHRFLPLVEDELVAIVPRSNPVSEWKDFPLRQFEKEPFIDIYPGKETDNSRTFAKYHIQPNVRYSTMDRFAGYSMAEAGLGVCMENRLIARRYGRQVAVLPLRPRQTVRIGVVYPEKDVISPAAEAFVRYALEETERPVL